MSVIELYALGAECRMTSDRNKVVLRHHRKFLPKAVSVFHLNQSINLPIFFPKPHSVPGEKKLYTLDVSRIFVLLRQQEQLIQIVTLSLRGHSKGQVISLYQGKKRSKWVMQYILLQYQWAGVLLPTNIKAHYSRVCKQYSPPFSEICQC